MWRGCAQEADVPTSREQGRLLPIQQPVSEQGMSEPMVLSFPPKPPVQSGETDTKAIRAQIKYLESCQSAAGEGKSLGVVNKA